MLKLIKLKLTIALPMMVLLATGIQDSEAEPSVVVAEGGDARLSIVTPQDPHPAVAYAAKELAVHLKTMTGATFDVNEESVQNGGPAIFVGLSEEAALRCGDIPLDQLQADSVLIRVRDDSLILLGGSPRGTLYAVYTFLQDELGCRWYAPDMEKTPTLETLVLEPSDIIYTPPFQFREYHSEGATDRQFAARARLNGREFLKPLPAEYGGHASMGGAHTLINKFAKPEDHFEAHPEWFAWRADSSQREKSQLCMTNAQLQQQVLSDALLYLAGEESTSAAGSKIVSISCADSDKACQCETCLASEQKYETPAGPLIDLLLAVAPEIEKTYPGAMVSTLAYWHTDMPPVGVRLPDNIIVQVGTLDRNHRLPVHETRFRKIIQGWQAVAKHLYIWDYDANFRQFIQPHPNHYIVGESLRHYQRVGVEGVFLQGAWSSCAELHQMRTWVYSQLLWNPRQSTQRLINEFCEQYYGDAGSYLVRYVKLINEAVNRDKSFFLGAYNHSTHKWLDLETMNQATRLFDMAQKAVEEDPERSIRVRKARLSIDLVWMQRYDELQQTAQQSGTEFLGPDDPYAELDRLEENEFGITAYREWRPYAEYLQKLRDRFPKPSSSIPPELESVEIGRLKEFQETTFTVEGFEGEVRDDPGAAGVRAMWVDALSSKGRIIFPTPEWQTGRWRILVSMRAEPAEGVPSVDIPICVYYRPYPEKRLQETARTYLTFDTDNANIYQLADLGSVEVAYGTEVQIQPVGVGHFGRSQSVWIDRVLMVRN